MTGARCPGVPQGAEPGRVDTALQDTMALLELELVRSEEQVLVRLRACLVELEAINQARSALAGRTESEVAEARHSLDRRTDSAPTGRWGR